MENTAEKSKNSTTFDSVDDINSDNANRLALGIMCQDKCTYEEAIQKITSLSLSLYCGEGIRASLSLQVAFLTALNCGKRAFLGGVYVHLPENVESLVHWPGKKSFNEIVKELGGKKSLSHESNYNLYFGLKAPEESCSLQVVTDGWRAGVVIPGEEFTCMSNIDFALSGVAAGSLAVALAFIKLSRIRIQATDHTVGISLWRPELNWSNPEAVGPKVEFLPKKLWVLGLGHLGQAYLWTLGMLLSENNDKPLIILQDFDKIVSANNGSGLLCEGDSAGKYKTRVCSKWLEDRGCETRIVERAFDQHIRINKETEPPFALCGFDKAEPRMFLEDVGFDYIVECALGGEISDFDKIFLHTFPNSNRPANKIWSRKNDEIKNTNQLNDNTGGKCGYLHFSNHAISSSFVGAFASAFVIGELLRGLNDGDRYEQIVIPIRNLGNKTITDPAKYKEELLRNGFIEMS